MTKNIYSELGFSYLKELIYPNQTVDEAKGLFNALPLKIVSMRQLIVERTIFDEAFAISTTEDSNLTVREAKKIMVSPEIKARLIKYREDKTLTFEKKYEYLEFENVKSVESDISSISFKELSIDLLCKLHHDLTVGLDEYCKGVGISHYYPGELRHSNAVKIGKIRQYIPPDHKRIRVFLKMLFKEFSSRKEIHLSDILEFHVLLYAIHPFQNGNKRVARTLESMLLHHYGYSAERALSLAVYYTEKKEESNFFLMESLRKKDPTFFVNFALRGYFYSGNKLHTKTLEQYAGDFGRNFGLFIKKNISSKKMDNYQKAGRAIVELNGVFTHGEFIEQMKKYKCTLGVSQEILKYLEREKIIQHENRLYYIEKAIEINEYIQKLTKFFLQYNIDTGG